MKQYYSIKSKYEDAILFFRVGDFYETFEDDAVICSKVLNIVLTRRSNGNASDVKLAGIPYHSIDSYLPKLVKAGYRIAICEQLEPPSQSKKIVKRGVSEIVTPGVNFSERVLNSGTSNYLSAVFRNNKDFGVAFLDISTADFFLAQGSESYINNIIHNFNPSEILISKKHKNLFEGKFKDKYYIYFLDDWVFNYDYAMEKILDQFSTKSVKGFGIQNMDLGIITAGSILHYLNETDNHKLKHISSIKPLVDKDYLSMDHFTLKNLEILNSLNKGGKSLFDIICRTKSPMGTRLLRKWMVLPLNSISKIEKRHSIIKSFIDNIDTSDIVSSKIKDMVDIERLVSKLAKFKISPIELLKLKESLILITEIISALEGIDSVDLKKIINKINTCDLLIDKIDKTINQNLSNSDSLSKTSIIKKGVSKQLDDLKNLLDNNKQFMEELLEDEKKKTGISSLKIGFNNVFGYYLDVRNKYKNNVPSSWIRRQTLTSSERYVTEEIKKYESQIMGAQDKISEIESGLFRDLTLYCFDYIDYIKANAKIISFLDCIISFAELAMDKSYTCPEIDSSFDIDIKGGRHPIIEEGLVEKQYIPNDISLDKYNKQILIITGPNMSGKSAILRQTALIVIMAQMGSFVPAKKAKIGIVDKIFTRIGASDNISEGESTFMLEMLETANILNNLSDRSLVILDEIGRGTSTYDGISIAWSIVEFLHNHKTKPKTLFATHYHELSDMTTNFGRIKNYNVEVKELDKDIVFTYKLSFGSSKHSFGIYVAKMAGIPNKVVKRANEIMIELEDLNKQKKHKKLNPKTDNQSQLSIIEIGDNEHNGKILEIKDKLKKVDINSITPIEAMMYLNKIKNILES